MSNKILVYGYGRILIRVLPNMIEEGIDFDIVDSDPKKWGGVYQYDIYTEKTILSPDSINVDDYMFCLIGSDTFSNEIYDICLNMGFSSYQIIPSEFLEQQFFGVKHIICQYTLLNKWKEVIEKDKRIRVIKNWYLCDDKTECIIEFVNCVGVEIKLSCCNTYNKNGKLSIDNIVKSNEPHKYICGTDSAKWMIDSDDMNIYKLSLSKHWGYVPWVSVCFEETDWYKTVNDSVLKNTFVQNLNWSTNFYYHDEDYLALYEMYLGGSILDLGGNYGQSMFAFYYMTDCNIYSVEASPNHANILINMKKLLSDEERINVLNVGISNEEEILKWYQPQDDRYSGSFYKKFIDGRNLECPIDVRDLKCQKIDDLFFDLNDIWFIKMDIEGFEEKGIMGAMKLISKCKPVILLENNAHKDAIISILSDTYEVRYYDYRKNFFSMDMRNDFNLNYWLIPKREYWNNRVEKFLDGRL